MSSLYRLVAPLAAALATALAAPAAPAATLGLHLASVHLPQRSFNNFNPGVYYRSDAGWTGGAYFNSLERVTAYAGYTWQRGPLGLTAGVATGYDRAVQPILVPSLIVATIGDVSARIAYIPRVEKRIESHVLHLMLEY
jgi:hypothetical protein